MQREVVERLEQEMLPASKGAEKMQISADGSMVPLLHGVWAEQYPFFQAQGWSIGSGIVESGNKLVVEARLKGSGIQ
jgi:hypothetical protein